MQHPGYWANLGNDSPFVHPSPSRSTRHTQKRPQQRLRKVTLHKDSRGLSLKVCKAKTRGLSIFQALNCPGVPLRSDRQRVRGTCELSSRTTLGRITIVANLTCHPSMCVRYLPQVLGGMYSRLQPRGNVIDTLLLDRGLSPGRRLRG